MTGAEFNTEVLAFLDTDAQRRGISAFREAFKRAAIADLAAYIDEFAVGKLTFADTEQTPFDTDSAEAVAEFLKSKIARNVDRDLQLSQAHWTDYLVLRRRLFVRLKEARTPEITPWIGKPYTVIFNLRKGALPQPIIGNVWFTVKAYRGDPDECAIFVLERNAGGIEILDANTSRIRVTMEHSHTSLLMEGVEYYWDVQVQATPLAIPLHGIIKGRQPVGVGRAPKITSQPVGGTIAVGQVLSMSVVASGKEPLTYQWRKDGVDMAGATSSTLSYTTSSIANSGNYDVVVSNPFGNTISDVAVWEVGYAPTITTHPVGGTFTSGQTLNLFVVATGEALSYQWRRNGINLVGATSSSYTDTVATNEGGSYDCVVSNRFGVVISNPALVTVLGAPPTVTTHPVGAALTVGQTINLFVVAIGEPPLSYQWRKGGVNWVGATSASFVVTTTSTDHSGTYDCVVTNPWGSDTSDPAVITVTAAPPIEPGGAGDLLREDGTPLLREDGTPYQREVITV